LVLTVATVAALAKQVLNLLVIYLE